MRHCIATLHSLCEPKESFFIKRLPDDGGDEGVRKFTCGKDDDFGIPLRKYSVEQKTGGETFNFLVRRRVVCVLRACAARCVV